MVERTERRVSPLWLILALLALALLIWFCVKNHRFDIQSKVEQNAKDAITSAGLALPTVTADGRDITLSGDVDRTVNLDALQNAAYEGDGVRVVNMDVGTLAAQPANVSLLATGDTAVVGGIVASEEERNRIIEAASKIYSGGVDDQIVVSNDVDSEGWIGGLTGWMPNLGGIRNPSMKADAQHISVTGDVVSTDDATALRSGLAAAAAEGQGTEMELSVYGGVRPSKVEAVVRDGMVSLNGEVDSEETVDSIKRAATSIFSGSKIDSTGLIADVEVSRPEWAENAGAVLEEARIIGNGAKLELSDSRIVVAGEVDSKIAKTNIINRVTAANTGVNVVDQLTVKEVEVEAEPVVEVAKRLENLDLPGLQFESGSAVLTQESVTKLGGLVSLLNEYPDARIGIVGHTDSQGDENYNLQLSRDRAQSVMQYLVDNGIAVDRLESNGMGQTQPIADNGTDEGRRQNRRIDFSVLN